MRRFRRRDVVVSALVFAGAFTGAVGLEACSDFSGATDTTASLDAGPVVEASTKDASAGNAGACGAATNVFCENFDGVGLVSELASTWGQPAMVVGGATLAIVDSALISRPNALEATMPASSAGGVAPAAVLFHDLLSVGILGTAECTVAVRVETVDPGAWVSLLRLDVQGGNDPDVQAASAQVTLHGQALELGTVYAGDGGGTSATYVPIDNVPLGVWKRIHLRVAGGHGGEASVDLDDAGSAARASVALPNTFVRAEVGLGFRAIVLPVSGGAVVDFDDLVCTLAP